MDIQPQPEDKTKHLYITYVLLYNMVKTTIQIDGNTLTKLKTCKIYKRESYDEIINRLMDISQGFKK